MYMLIIVIHFHFMGGTILYSESSFFFVIMQMHQFNRSVVSNCLQPHGLQHARPPCPSPTPRVYSNSCLLGLVMPFNHLILCHPLLLSSLSPSIMVFSKESVLRIRWSKYWSFSFSIRPSSEYLGLISFRMDWLDSQESFPTPQFKSIDSSVLSFLYSPTLTSICDYWKNHSFD